MINVYVLRYLFTMLLGLSFFCLLSLEAGAQVSTREGDSSKGFKKLEAEQHQTRIGGKESIFSNAIFMGHLLTIDQQRDSLYLKPISKSSPRRNIYFDRKTIFTSLKGGKRRKIKAKDLIEGERIAVRFFARGKLALAEEVFLVEGEFQPTMYEKKTRLVTKEVAGATSKEANEAKEGGEEKTAEKKGGH